MNQLPNILTVSRIILTFVFLYFMTQDGITATIISAFIFWSASITDYFDGYLARKKNLTSNFGKIMDPIADKFLILAAFFALFKMGFIPAWIFLVIFLREILVTGSRLIVMRKGKILTADKAGKLKTTLQMVTISVILLYMIFEQSSLYPSANSSVIYFSEGLIYILLLLTVAITLYSGFSYAQNYRKFNYA